MAEAVASDHQADDVLSLESTSSISSMSDLGDAAEEARASGAAVTAHHEEFYLEDEHVKLQAGVVIYRVHAHFFMKESDEARMLVKRAAVAADRLLVLDNVASEDLEAFLKALYCRIFESSPLSSKAEWASVLHLAHTWNFASMRAYAIGKLAALTTPVDRIVLGKKYDIVHWLHPAYRVVCERQACLSDEEGARLGVADVLRISRARQDLRIPALLRSSDFERFHAFTKTFGIEAPISYTSAALAPQFKSPIIQDEPRTPVAVNSTPCATTRSMRAIPSAIDISGETIEAFERNCITPQPSDDGELPQSELAILAPISDAVRGRLKAALVQIEAADRNAMKAQQSLDTAEKTYHDAQEIVNEAAKKGCPLPTYVHTCAIAQTSVDEAQRVVASSEQATEHAHSTLAALVLADLKVEPRSASYNVPADTLTALRQLVSTIDSAHSVLLEAEIEGIDSRKREDENPYVKSWKRMHDKNPTTDTAQALEDARRQVELSKVRCARKIADAENEIARTQRKLAQLLTQVAVAASSS